MRNVHPRPFVIRPAADLLERQPDLRRASADLARHYTGGTFASDEFLQAIGARLWQLLGVDAEFDAACQSSGAQITALQIESADAAIQQLPWELLYHPQRGFLGREPGFTLSRSLGEASNAPGAPPLESGPLRVLLFTSLPDDLHPERGRLNTEEEQAQVQEALMPWISSGQIVLEMPDDGRFETLREQIHGFRPQLLFLSGHGTFAQTPGQAGAGQFVFEDEWGRSELHADAEIAALIPGSSLRCVVLSACESGKSASDALNAGLARSLSAAGVAQVIGMRESILDRAGTLFAWAFFDAIGQRERVDVALQLGRAAIVTPLGAGPLGAGPLRDSDSDSEANDATAALSLGQWCLPSLIAADPGAALIDWAFEPQPPQAEQLREQIDGISLPPRFIGRRSEQRQFARALHSGELRQLLISGAGGQGKTALAGRLAQRARAQGFRVIGWSARPQAEGGTDWQTFLLEQSLALPEALSTKFDKILAADLPNESARAALLIKLLLQTDERPLLLFFDNLESLQQSDDRALDNPAVQGWIDAALALDSPNLRLLLTSRFELPDWPDSPQSGHSRHWPLEKMHYGDYLQLARRQPGLRTLGEDRDSERARLRRVYHTLHGNCRGLEVFAAAIGKMNSREEADFLARLAEAEQATQLDMALAEVVARQSEPARQLLQRLPAFDSPVPREGVIALARVEPPLAAPPSAK